MKIDKKLREQANKEHQEILDSNKAFFDEVLMPAFEEKRQQAAAQKRCGRCPEKLRYGLFAIPVAAIITVITLCLVLFPKPEKTYLGPFETEPSDLQTVNQCLIKTKLCGDIETIIISYDAETKNTMYFTMYQQIAGDDAVIQNNIELVIERSLTFDYEKTDYQKRLTHLGYEVKFNEFVTQDLSFEDMPIYEFNITAYIDTGKERFYMTYYEISLNDQSSFAGYLAALIQVKN